MAASKTFTDLYTYIMRQKKPFRFLDLPAEMRNLVYDHHFKEPSYRGFWLQSKARGAARPSNAILHINRQVYGEASHVLYSKLIFIAQIAGTAKENGDEGPFSQKLRKIPNVLQHVTIIHLEIYWSHAVWRCQASKLQWERKLADRMHRIDEVLMTSARLPNLRTIKIFFLLEEASHPLTERSPARYQIEILLWGLARLQRRRPEIVVELPEDCPMSSTELARHHWTFSQILNCHIRWQLLLLLPPGSDPIAG